MPLVRVEVRNEYGLGAPELYKDVDKEDPKALLEGFAVAGLVGILRQLGDLAEFAGEVFHGLQEQITITSSRSQKLMGRVKRIEAALPPLEKLVLAQRSHLHFAYTTGLNWRANLRDERNHLIYSDLPRFMMDSYDQCQGPPNFSLLDRFDPGGPGSCLKRYSNPSLFKKPSTGRKMAHKKSRKIKKKRSRLPIKQASFGVSNYSGSMRSAVLNLGEQASPCPTFSTYDVKRSELGEQSIFFDSRNGSVDFDHLSHARESVDYKEKGSVGSSSSQSRMRNNESHDFASTYDKDAIPYYDSPSSISGDHTGPNSHQVTWDEKLEMLVAKEYDHANTLDTVSAKFILDNNERDTSHLHRESMEAFSPNLGLETDEKQTGHFPASISANSSLNFFEKGTSHLRDESMESFSPNHGLEADEKRTDHSHTSLSTKLSLEKFESGSSHLRDESVESSSPNLNIKADEKRTDHFHTSDTLSTNSSLENLDRGTSHLRDESLEFSPKLNLEADGKTDHLSTSEVYPHGRSLEILSTNVNMEKQRGTLQFETPGQMDILLENEKWSTEVADDIHHEDLHSETVGQSKSHLDGENIFMPHSADFQHDEIESETDHFVDALNAIESEYESDVDCQTKQEVEQHLENKENGNQEDSLTTPGLLSHNSEILLDTRSSSNVNTSGVQPDPVSPDFCSEVKASQDKITWTDIGNSVPAESHVSFQPQLPDEASTSSSLRDVDSINNNVTDNAKIESAVSNVSFFGMDATFVRGNDKSTDCSPVLPKPPPEPSTVSSSTLWTNGGLLGLEPSKPPVFSAANVVSQVALKSKEDTSTSLIPKSNTIEKSTSSSHDDGISECSTSYQDDNRGRILTRKAQWNSASSDLGVNLLKLSDSYLRSSSSISQKDAFSQFGTIQPVRPDVESSRASLEKSNSSIMLELGNRLLPNGFYRKAALTKDDDTLPASSMNGNGFEQSSSRNVGYKTFSAGGREMVRSESPMISPPSSPPVGHMKISFQPMNGSEAPKLQLRFPDGNINHEGGRDLFTSFQLVPDPNIQFRTAGSDSDDDTFCRSSRYESDCLSHQSDSNSEQWESSESPSNKDNELYDALRRISMTESNSTPREAGGAVQGGINNSYAPHSPFPGDRTQHSYSSHSYDGLPCLDTIHPSFKEARDECVPEQHYQKQFTSSPLPPPEQHYQKQFTTSPLPPKSQGQAMKPQLELPESRQVFMPQNLGYVFDGKLASTITHPPKPAPVNQEKIKEAAHTLNSKPQDLKKSTPERKVNQAANGNVEETGDFLQQIRRKSLNLRRTAPPKETVTAGTTSNQVNAILEKANAIRQAVGSDWEDDTWSDT